MDVSDYPDDRFYDMNNQIWYEPLADGTVRAGFTPWAAALMGEILVFTPKRIGREFEKDRSFAVIEGGKWVGTARAAFDGVVVAYNDAVIDRPELIGEDAFGAGWMLVVRPARADWREGLATGQAIAPAFAAWLATEAYKDRAN
jgi:glycine cleavage system H protein